MNLDKIEDNTMNKKFMIQVMQRHAFALIAENSGRPLHGNQLENDLFKVWLEAVDNEFDNLKKYIEIEKLLSKKKKNRETFTLQEGRYLINQIAELQKPLVVGRNDVVGYTVRNDIIKEIMDLIR